MNLQAAVEEFLLAGRADGHSPATAKWYRSMLMSFASACQGEPQTVSTNDIRQYIVGLRQRDQRYQNAPQKPPQKGGLSHASVSGHITALHAFWAWAAREYKFPNPMANIKRAKRQAPEPKAISAADFEKLFKATGEDIGGVRDRALLVFLADSGVRLGGVVGLTLDKLYLSERYALVTEKGAKTRKVVYTHYTRQMLDKWLLLRPGRSNSLFVSITTGEPLTASGIEQILKRLKRRAGVSGRVNPHSFRHNFARAYITNGGDIITLAKLLGHVDPKVTSDFYAVFSDDELAAMHEKYSPLKNLQVIAE